MGYNNQKTRIGEFMKTAHSHSLILLALLLIQAFGFNSSMSLADEIIVPNTSQILDFTDILDISELNIENIELDRLPGKYISEQGGAVLSLHITPQGKSCWIVERIYSEPSMLNVPKKYMTHKTDLGLVDENASFFLRQTREGLIAFEQNSELDTIPNDYWIHYIKQE